MPTYEYKCSDHGYFAVNGVPMAKSAEPYPCRQCGEDSVRVILSAPRPLIEAMADAGCPGALHTSGDRMTKRHYDAGQYHKDSDNVAAAARAIDAELTYSESDTAT